MKNLSAGFRWPILQGVLPIKGSQVPTELVAGLTLAALAIPEVMGYTKISGTPLITGLYTILLPMAVYAIFCSSRHLVVGADSATAAILASGLAGLASTGSEMYLALAGLLALMAAVFLLMARIIGLGFMADFLSRTVLTGFLTGIGIQVALGRDFWNARAERGGDMAPCRKSSMTCSSSRMSMSMHWGLRWLSWWLRLGPGKYRIKSPER